MLTQSMPNSRLMEEVHLTTIKPRNNVLLLAQEISFAKVLACNDKRLRDRGVKRLKKWFKARSEGSFDFTRDDHMRIWKGLFYCMWMSDKPLIQEELAEEISNLIHSFSSIKASLLFVETFFASLSVEWFGIDQLRLDKFMMLVRRFMRQSLELVARISWPQEQVQQLADIYYRTLTTAPMGLNMHIIEVFCEELAKVGKGEISSETILQFMSQFARVMATLKDGRLISQITRCVFLHLIRQTELGIEHQMKFSAWKEYGFPGGDVDAAEKVELEDEESIEESDEDIMEEEREVGVDARAGKVDVLLPALDFEIEDLLKVLKDLRNKKETTTKARKTLIQLITKFETLAAGKYPLGLHKVDLPNKVDKKKEIDKAAKRLYVEEQKLMCSDSDTEGNEEDAVLLGKINKKKKKALKQKKLVWEISEASESGDHSESSVSNTSWEISNSARKTTSMKPNISKKRKLHETEPDFLNNKCKKNRVSVFSVSESKENSFSSPAINTPKKKNSKNILKKNIFNNQNVSPEENQLPLNADISNKHTQNLNKLNKKKSKNINKSNSSVASVNGKTQNTSVNGVDEFQEKLNSTMDSVKASEVHVNKNNKNGETSVQLNTTTSHTNNGWGGEWDEPLKDGEYEIFIPNKKYVEKRKSLGLPFPLSSFIQNSGKKVTPINKLTNKVEARSATPNSQKKVEFNLNANSAQDYRDYARKMQSSKRQVPFDATKKPVQGLLKNSTPSPINPFYKKKLNFLASPVNA